MGSERAEAKKDVSPLKKAFQPSPSSCTGCLCHCKPCRGKGLLQAAVLFNLPGSQLCFNHQLHLWRILPEHNLDLRSDLPGPLSQLCWSVSQTNQSSCSCCSETSGEGFLQAAVLLHLPGCQLCFNHQLHLWRILLENHIDLCPDLPRSCQSGIN